MTTTEAIKTAKTVAAVRGWTGRAGGWIYDELDRPICKGWTELARLLRKAQMISTFASGRPAVDWRAMDLAVNLTARVRRGY